MNPLSPSAVLSRATRIGLLLAVVLGHAGIAWALMQAGPVRQPLKGPPKMEVRLVTRDPSPPAWTSIDIPLAQDTPPPEWQPDPQLERAVAEPPPDLPPPVFPVVKPPLPMSVQPKPVLPPVAAPPPLIGMPVETIAQPDTPPAPRTVLAGMIAQRVPPRPVYPRDAVRSRESGTAFVTVLIDASGKPEEVSLEASSKHDVLDSEALRCVRAALFHPYIEDGVPQPVRITIPIHFILIRE
jgi:protein TonB